MDDLLGPVSDTEVDWCGFEIYVIQQPQTKLPEAIQQILLLPIAGLVNAGFGTNRNPQSIKKHTLETDLLMVTVDQASGNWVGFSSYLNFLVDDQFWTLYLYGASVRPEFQGKGICSQMAELAVSLGNPPYTHLAMRTQNPAAVVLMSKLTPKVYVRPTVPAGSGVNKVAEFVRQTTNMANFEPGTFKVKGVYSGMLTAARVSYQGTNPIVDEFNQLELNHENGDCIVVVGIL